MRIFLLLIVMALPTMSFAAKSVPKNNLLMYVKQVSKLTDKKYMMKSGLKGDVQISKNFVLNKINAENFISRALYLNGYTRIPLDDKEGYMIIESRDIRYTPVPQYKATKEEPANIPNNHDYYMLTYTAKNTPQLMTEFTRSVRPFMSRYGRIIVSKFNNFVIIQDTGVNINRLYELAKTFDNPINKESKKLFENQEVQNFELKKLEAANRRNCSSENNFNKNKHKSK